ncbi:hypothetical protein [Methanoregula sp.]|uniref:hypothetical protein n=1 Tax=Methanoregula sp. TaxID=2052170 RepID=UPI003C7270AF
MSVVILIDTIIKTTVRINDTIAVQMNSRQAVIRGSWILKIPEKPCSKRPIRVKIILCG